MKRFLLLTLLFAMPTAYAAELQAPLGLEWGMTQGQAKSKGIKLLPCEQFPLGITVCKTENPPKSVSFAEHYFLTFFPEHGLHSVRVVGETIKSDVYGTKGKELYASLKARLTKKYGDPSNESEQIGITVFVQTDEFYQCLDYDGCGQWWTGWKPSNSWSVSLSLVGWSRGEGFITIDYTSAKYSEIRESHKQRQDNQDDSGL